MQSNNFIKTQKVDKCFDKEIESYAVVGKGRDFEYNTCSNTFELRSCDNGDIIYLHPAPTQDALGIIYSPEFIPFQFHKMGGVAKIGRDFLQYKKAMSVIKLLDRSGRHKIKILDVGCGSGVFLRMLKKIIGSGQNLYANDFSEAILEPLKKEGINVIAGNLDEFAINEKFDVITLIQVIEHLPNPLKTIKNLSIALKDGGYLFIETPSIDSLDAKIFSKGYWDGYQIPRHLWLFNERSLRKMALLANLRVIKVKYFPYPIFWIHSLKNMFSDRNYPRIARIFTYRNPLLLIIFTIFDAIILMFYGKTSHMRIVLQKGD